MALPFELAKEVKGRHAKALAKQLANPSRDEKRVQTSSESRKIFEKHNHD